MTIIHRMKTLPRAVGAALSERLGVMPAVAVTGDRQTGTQVFWCGRSMP